MRNLLLASAALAVFIGGNSAQAADLGKPVYKAPPPVILSDWAGFYIGVAGGGGWGATSFDPVNSPLNAKPTGGVFGGYAGYNWQFGPWVTGVEVDFSGADIKATQLGITEKTNELGSVRGRLGYTITPNLLAYGTGGFGWGHSTIDAPGFSSQSVNQTGWVAGAGLEFMFSRNWIARAEYLHYDFGKETFNFPVVFPPIMSETVDVVRGGVSYKF